MKAKRRRKRKLGWMMSWYDGSVRERRWQICEPQAMSDMVIWGRRLAAWSSNRAVRLSRVVREFK